MDNENVVTVTFCIFIMVIIAIFVMIPILMIIDKSLDSNNEFSTIIIDTDPNGHISVERYVTKDDITRYMSNDKIIIHGNR